jgi:hypothetical protein
MYKALSSILSTIKKKRKKEGWRIINSRSPRVIGACRAQPQADGKCHIKGSCPYDDHYLLPTIQCSVTIPNMWEQKLSPQKIKLLAKISQGLL